MCVLREGHHIGLPVLGPLDGVYKKPHFIGSL